MVFRNFLWTCVRRNRSALTFATLAVVSLSLSGCMGQSQKGIHKDLDRPASTAKTAKN